MRGLKTIYTKGQTPIEGTANLSNLTTIGQFSFVQNAFSKVIFNDEIKAIGNTSFYQCASLTALKLPASCTSIGATSFYGCSSLKSVKFPSSLTEITGEPFTGCSGVTTIEVENEEATFDEKVLTSFTGLTTVKGKNNSTAQTFAAANNLVFTSTDSVATGPIGKDLTFVISNNEDGTTYTMEILGTGKNCIAMTSDGTAVSTFWNTTAEVLATRPFAPYASKITKLKISAQNITSFSQYMFKGLDVCTTIEVCPQITSMTSVSIFNGMTGINTFYTTGQTPETGVANLTNLTGLGAYMFVDQKFTSIKFNDTIKVIPNYCFGCQTANSKT